LATNTLNVAQFSSNFSILNTVDVTVSSGSFDIGIANLVLQQQLVYIVIGLVLQQHAGVPHPKHLLSHVSKQLCGMLASLCNTSIVLSISYIQLLVVSF
jgi:hypothetical protein